VSFTYTPGGLPVALPFMVNDANFTPLFAGLTTVTAVPEPAAAVLAAIGLAVVGLRTARSGRPAPAHDQTPDERRNGVEEVLA
jgi:hypothetical protein